MKKTTLEDVSKVIRKWMKSNNNNVDFFGSFVAYDEKKMNKKADDIISEDNIICYGYRNTLKIALDDFIKMFKKDKSEFINW